MAIALGESDVLTGYDVPAVPQRVAVPRWWPRLALAPILVLSALLEFANLSGEGYANSYYSAAIKSMLTNWHNFFYLSFDSGGFVSVDKSPLGLWIEAASAKVFGFSGLAMLAPEALAGVLSVALLYWLVARPFGPVAGLIAALALAVTPVTVVTDRNNTIDSLLILTLLLGVWAAARAAATGRLSWLRARPCCSPVACAGSGSRWRPALFSRSPASRQSWQPVLVCYA
jgi:4-amino-4-deoxy-L-arabinose transferase-like glycosyltransferase